MNFENLIYFEVPEEWKQFETEYLNSDKNTEEDEDEKGFTIDYIFVNNHNKDVDDKFKNELIYILKVIKNIENKNRLKYPYFKTKFIDNNNVLCPISNEFIVNGDTVALLYYKNDEEIYYYLIVKSNIEEYICCNYIEKGNNKVVLNDEQIKGEIIFNSRWSTEIYKKRKEKDIFISEIRTSIYYLQEILNKHNKSIVRDLNEELQL
jgi:hypothetical protein